MTKCFWAYSNSPYNVSENISVAVDVINKSDTIYIETWEAMDIEGHFIIDEILKDIDACDFFICELSNLNFNVLFELGYAIAKKKKIRIFVNFSLQNVKETFNCFDLLTSIGYVDYINSVQIQNSLWSILQDSDEDILTSIVSTYSGNNYSNLLYMKSSLNTNASIALTRAIDELKLKLVIDDPREVSNQTLDWYVKNLVSCNGFVAHFESEKYANIEIWNAKASLVSGIAFGLRIPLLMIAAYPFKTPIDYKKIIRRYNNRNECVDLLKEWYDENSAKVISDESIRQHTQQEIRALSSLQSIDLGENLAENESEKLLDYFVKTSSFYDALNRNLSIFIGRKGTGKTANLLNLADEYKGKRNHVCVIKPIGYEIEGILEMLQKLTNAERGFLIESIWKYLIYTELLKSIFNDIKLYPPFRELDDAEKVIVNFVEENTDIVLPEFSIRLESIVDRMVNLKNGQSDTMQDYQLRVSELLHNNIINKLRGVIGSYCVKKDNVVILIDNLDKAWQSGSNIEILSNFLFGLLDVGNSIIRDFAKENNWRKPVNLSLIIFLREDIFTLMDKYVPERDKLQIGRITWEDREVLLRVIEERLQDGDNIDVWAKYFCKDVLGEDVKNYIIDNIVPRPRDIITLIKAALGNAVSRKHTLIEEKDLQDALNVYSKFALDTLITEMSPEFASIRNFLYELSGDNEIVHRSDLKIAMNNAKIDKEKEEHLIAMLCKMSFLGLEVKPDSFEFCYNEDQYRKYDAIARKNILKNNITDCRYKIHKAFYPELMIGS